MTSMGQTSFEARRHGSKAARQGGGGHGWRLASPPPLGAQNTRQDQDSRFLSTKTTDTPYLPRLISKKRGTWVFRVNPSRTRVTEHFSVPALFSPGTKGASRTLLNRVVFPCSHSCVLNGNARPPVFSGRSRCSRCSHSKFTQRSCLRVGTLASTPLSLAYRGQSRKNGNSRPLACVVFSSNDCLHCPFAPKRPRRSRRALFEPD